MEAITALEERYAVVIEEDMQLKLLSALDAKTQVRAGGDNASAPSGPGCNTAHYNVRLEVATMGPLAPT